MNVSVQYNGGFLRHYTVDPMLLPSGNPIKCHEEVLSLQSMIPPKPFDIFSSDWGMLRRSKWVNIFLCNSIGIRIWESLGLEVSHSLPLRTITDRSCTRAQNFRKCTCYKLRKKSDKPKLRR